MNAHTFLVDGQQLHPLRRRDLPDVARAIVGYERKQVRVERHFHKNVSYYRFVGPHFTTSVLAKDWEKIAPYLQDGSINPQEIALGPAAAKETPHNTDFTMLGLHITIGSKLPPMPPVEYPTQPQDNPFYVKVLGILTALFPEEYPVSNL